MVKRVEYKIWESIYSGEGGNDQFIGGSVSVDQVDSILPTNITIPAKGDGDRWIYRKYWLSITNVNFDGSPVISDVTVTGLGASGCHITWNTDIDGDSFVDYGTDTDQTYFYVTGNSDQTGVGEGDDGLHNITLGDLNDGTRYFFKCRSKDIESKEGDSQEFSFITIDESAPVYNELTINAPIISRPQVRIVVDEGSTGTITYGQTGADGIFGYNYGTGKFTNIDTSHSIIFDSTPSGYWYFNIEMEDTDKNSNVSGKVELFLPETGEDGQIDDPGPTITALHMAATGAFNATIDWQTDRPCLAKVVWGTGVDLYFAEQQNNFYRYVHSALIVGLVDDTVHYFRPVAIDQSSLTTTGDEDSFTTRDGTVPSVTGLEIVTTATGATISWGTTEPSSGAFAYGTGIDRFDGDPTGFIVTPTFLAINWLAIGTGLAPSTIYYGRILARDDSTNTGEFKNFIFETSGDADTTAPVISNLIATPIPSGGQFTWTTDEPAKSHIEYNEVSGLSGQNTGEYVTFVIDHDVSVSGLKADTTYFYEVTVYDPATNTGNSQWKTWSTPEGEDESLFISNVRVVNITDTSASIEWVTNKNSNSLVNYGVGNTTDSSASDSTQVLLHSVPLASLTASTEYTFKCTSTTLLVPPETAVSDDFTFTTEPPVGGSNLTDGEELGILEFQVPEGNFVNNTIPIHAVIPLLEETDLNINWKITGPGNTDALCQRELVKRKADGTWISVEIIALINLPAGASAGDIVNYTLVATDTALPGNFNEAHPGPLTMKLSMPGGSPFTVHTADILTDNANKTVFKEGHVCKTYRYYNRLTDNTGKNTLGIQAYITWYNNFNVILIRLRIHNAHIDPTLAAGAGGEHGKDYDVVGMIFFDEMWVERTQVGVDVLVNRCIRYCGSQPSVTRLNFIEYGPNDSTNRSVQNVRSEIFPPGFSRMEHIAIAGRNVYAGGAVSMLEYQNFAHMVSGRNQGRDVRHWGPCLYRTGRFTSDYAVDGLDFSHLGLEDASGKTFFGRAGENYRRRMAGDLCKYNLQNNTIEAEDNFGLADTWDTSQLGAWHPWLLGDKGTRGGTYYLAHAEEQDMTPGVMKSYTYYADTITERGNDYFMVNSSGGLIGAKDWRDNHGGAVPFFTIFTTSTRARRITPFFGPGLTNVKELEEIITISNYGYNGGTCDYLARPSFNHWDNGTPIGDSHIQRKFRCYQGLINEYNCPMYRDQLKALVEFSLLTNDRATSFNVDFSYESEQTLADYDASLGVDSANWYKSVDTPGRSWGRGKAWSNYIIAMFYTYALDKVGTYGSLVHTEDLYLDGTNWRTEVYQHFILYHSIMLRAVPGGPGLTSPAHMRFMESSTFGSSAFSSDNQDMGGILLGVSAIASDFAGNIFNKSYEILTTTTAITADLAWWNKYSSSIAEITLDAGEGSAANSMNHGEDFIIREKGTTTAVGQGTLDLNSPTIKFIQSLPTLRYPLDMAVQFGYGQNMEMEYQAVAWFAVATAAFDNVDNDKRDDLYNYVYDFSEARLVDAIHLIVTNPTGKGPVSGYMSGTMAMAHYNGQTKTFANRVDFTTIWGERPQEHPWERELHRDPNEFHTFVANVCSLYAAEALGIHTADSNLTRPHFLEPLRFMFGSAQDHANSDFTAFLKKNFENSDGQMNAWDVTGFMSPYVGELQWRRNTEGGGPAGDGSGEDRPGDKVKKLRLGLRQKFGSGKIMFAVSKDEGSAIEVQHGQVDGDQSIVQFYESIDSDYEDGGSTTGDGGDSGDPITGNVTSRPEFVTAYGQAQFLTLPGNDGTEGGTIFVEDSTAYAVPFWVALRLEENETATDILIDFGVDAEQA